MDTDQRDVVRWVNKKMEMTEGLRKMLKTGVCELRKEEVNKVVYDKEEIRMVNIRNRKKEEEQEEQDHNG